MTSFRIGISPSRRAAARFVARVRRTLQRALVEERERSGANQSKIAESLGVHRSVISRELNGLQNITLGRVAELAWAMGREIEFDLVVPELRPGSNVVPATSGAIDRTVHFESLSQNIAPPPNAVIRPSQPTVLELVS